MVRLLSKAPFMVCLSFLVTTSVSSAASLPALSTTKNHITVGQKKVWVAHGVNLLDPRCNSNCYDSKTGLPNDNPALAIARLKYAVSLGANLIRIPLEADRLQINSQSDLISDPNYLAGIQSLVAAATSSAKTYVLLSIWHDPTLVYNPKNKTHSGEPTAQTDSVLNLLVDTFHANPGVIYGVSNEPFSVDDANIWLSMDHAVSTIRKREAQYSDSPHLVSVQGRFFTQDLTYYTTHPIQAGNGNNVIYEAHLYDQNYVAPLINASKKIPVFVGEFGPAGPVDPNSDWQGYSFNNYQYLQSNMTLAQVSSAIAQFRKAQIPYCSWAFAQAGPPDILANSPNDQNKHFTCNPDVPNPGLTSWGLLVAKDLKQGYYSAGTQAAIELCTF